MSGTAMAAPIKLSQWFGSLAANRSPTREDPANESLNLGPLTVTRAVEGCETATFGPPDNLSVLLFDGYLFDRVRLASELGVSRNESTAALVAAAYRRWGTDLFPKLDGRYMVAVWDARRSRLFIGHDPTGRSPAYYARTPGAVSFASNVLALASSGLVDTDPNRLSLALALLFYWPATGQTFFEQIHRVPPGVYLEVTPQLDVIEHDYSPPILDDEETNVSEREVLERFEPALIRAVDRCVDLSPEGIMFSGGVDSVVIAALASASMRARQMPPLVAVSARGDLPPSYEEHTQESVAQVLNMRHVLSLTKDHLHGRDSVVASLDAMQELPAPSDVYWIGAYLGFCRDVARRDIRVLLTGSGGDDWLGVGNMLSVDLLRRLQFRQLLRFIRASTGTGGSALGKAGRQWLWAGGFRPLLNMAWERALPRHKTQYHRRKWYDHLPAWLAPEPRFREELIDHLLERRTPSLTADRRMPRNYYRHAMRTTVHPQLPYEYETDHHTQALCGLRLLSPYHDHTLVQFFTRIPPDVLIHGDRYKGLLRPVAAKYLPGLGLENQRKTYTQTSQNYFLGRLRGSITQIWPGEGFAALGRMGVVEPAATKNLGRNAAVGEFRPIVTLYTLMSAERWVRAHTHA